MTNRTPEEMWEYTQKNTNSQKKNFSAYGYGWLETQMLFMNGKKWLA
ncbi:MAG: hypothetical protein V8Q91_10490 [Bilophila wadsworthia]